MSAGFLWRVAVRVHITGLATLAFVAMALTSWRWLGFVLLAVTIALEWRQRPPRPPRSKEHVLLAAAVLVDYDRVADGGHDAVLVLAGLALVAMISQEAALRRVGQRITAMNLRTGREPANLGSRSTEINIVLIVATGVSAALALPAWPLVAMIGLISVLYARAVLNGLRRRGRPQQDGAVRRALERVAPEFVVHYSGPKDSEYQVLMWLPYLERLGRPFFVVLREWHGARRIAAATAAPVVICPGLAALDEVLVPSLRAAFYVNNGMKNTHPVRFTHLTHIQLLHGDSDKPPSYNPVTAMYDRIFVAGQAGIDRYAKNGVSIPLDRFTIVGRPQLESVEVVRRPIAESTDKVVLYAPTWTSHYTDTNYCSLPIGEPIVRRLLDQGATVILRAHPYTAHNPASARQLAALEAILAEDRARTGRHHLWGAAGKELSVIDCINRADALVSDVSSVVSDFLYSGKPFAITDMVSRGEAFVDAFPLAAAGYVIRRDLTNLGEALGALLHLDPLAAQRWAMRTYYLGDFPPEAYADAFISEARRSITRPAAAQPAI